MEPVPPSGHRIRLIGRRCGGPGVPGQNVECSEQSGQDGEVPVRRLHVRAATRENVDGLSSPLRAESLLPSDRLRQHP